MEINMRFFLRYSETAILATLVIATTLSSCSNAGSKRLETSNPMLDRLGIAPPADAVLDIKPPEKQRIEPNLVLANLPLRGNELVRLTRNGILIDKAERFEAEVLKPGTEFVQLSDNTTLAIRQPKNTILKLAPKRYMFDYRPTTTAGSDESSLTISSNNKQNSQTNQIVLQAVQRGSHSPVQIEEGNISVKQINQGKLIQDSKSEAAYAVPVSFSISNSSVTLQPDSTKIIQANKTAYRISLLRSLFFDQHESRFSNEGPTYFLEYIITEVAE